MARRSIAGCRGILTGASSGIGRALATQLVQQGARLVVVARRVERLRTLVESLAGSAGEITLTPGDITDPVVRAQAVDLAERAFGGLDLLINNAGSGAMGAFADADGERLHKIMEINFFAAADMIRVALPALRRGTRPMVVNVGSILGHRGVPFCSEYCASKFAIQGLSESLRAEFARIGLDLLVVSPARTQTEFFDSAVNPEHSRFQSVRGLPAEVVARKTIRAIQAGRHEIVVSATGKLIYWANRLSPRLLDAILARYG